MGSSYAARLSSPSGEEPPVLIGLLARHSEAVILGCFFLSGATGLIYEVVWSRRLTLIFGATVLAVSTVLAVFLGGLAVGSLVFGRIADRRRDHLRTYAALEGAVGLACFATPWLFLVVEHSYTYLHLLVADHLWLVRLVRFALCALALFIPTVLMGGTLPVLSRAVVPSLPQVGRQVARLYGINTLGAVAGAAGAGFLLIPTVGITSTIYLAALLNLGIAVVALALHVAKGGTSAAVPAAEHSPAFAPPARVAYLGLLLAYALSGAAALIYEVAWTRVLSLAFGTTTYAFSAMLAAFLLGLGLGSIVLASPRLIRLEGMKTPLLWFGVVEVAIGASVTLLTPVLDRLPLTFLVLFRHLGSRFWALQAAETVICVAVMLLPAALMGLAFPLVTHIATDALGALGRRLSAVYAANTLGTVLGSVGAGFLLIPAVGVRATIAVGVALNLLVGLAYLVGLGRARPSLAGLGLACAAVAVLGWLLLPDWNKHILTSGAYIYPGYYLVGDAVGTMEEKEILHYRDALTGTISVTRVNLTVCPEPVISLQINGKTDASTVDLSTQLMLAHLPALLHPEPRSALVVGLASGCTLGALGLHPEVRQVDCVEIEPEMARVTGFFTHVNHDCLQDPRVRLVFDDARNFVRVTPRRYDLVTSEPSNPWISGVANLFTREYFTQCREHLAPRGVFCQWIPIYNLSPGDLQCVMATFQEVLPNCSLWLFPALPSDAYLVGTLGPEAVDVTRLTRRAEQPGIVADLKACGLRDCWEVLAGRVLGPEAITAASRGAPLNTDDLPVLEFTSPLVLHTGIPRSTMLQVIELGQRTQTPLGVCGEQIGQVYRSDLTGLRLGPPFSRPAQELLAVRRDPTSFAGAQGGGWAYVVAHLVCSLGRARADIYAWRADLPSGEDVPDVPQRDPDCVLSVSGHRTGLWQTLDATGVVEWVARWTCPSQGRSYMIVARAEGGARLSGAKEALAHTVCCAGGQAAGSEDKEAGEQ